MTRVLDGPHSFTCTPRVHPLTDELYLPLPIGVDLAGILGGRMARAEGGSVLSGVGYGKCVPSSADLGL